MPDLADVYVGQAADRRREHWSGPPEMVDRIAALMETRREHLVVDVGCGVGGPARRLFERTACTVVGVDLVPRVLRAATRRSGGAILFVAGAAQALPMRSGFADQVWALGVAAHVPDTVSMLAEAARVLRGGGRFAMTEVLWEGRGPPRFAATAPQPWQPLTVSGVMSAMEAAGLDDIRAVPWPAHDVPGALDTTDEALSLDLREGRLVPGFLVARKP